MAMHHGSCVLIVLMVLMGCMSANTIGHKKREWPIKLCTSDEDCNGGCCKGLFCFRYLGENERCLFGHHLKVGCGCEEPLSCKMKNFSYKCIKPIIENNENINSITNFPQAQVVEELDRELQALLPNEDTAVASDNADIKREAATEDDEVTKKEEENDEQADSFEKQESEEEEEDIK